MSQPAAPKPSRHKNFAQALRDRPATSVGKPDNFDRPSLRGAVLRRKRKKCKSPGQREVRGEGHQPARLPMAVPSSKLGGLSPDIYGHPSSHPTSRSPNNANQTALCGPSGCSRF